MAKRAHKSIRREDEMVALAQLVLTERLAGIDEPGLVATVEFKPQDRFEDGLIGYIISVPHPSLEGYQVASAPAVRVEDATPASLGRAFNEGLSVILNKIEKVDA